MISSTSSQISRLQRAAQPIAEQSDSNKRLSENRLTPKFCCSLEHRNACAQLVLFLIPCFSLAINSLEEIL